MSGKSDTYEAVVDIYDLTVEVEEAINTGVEEAGADNAGLFTLYYWANKSITGKLENQDDGSFKAFGPVAWVVAGSFDKDSDCIPFVIVPTHAEIGRKWTIYNGWILDKVCRLSEGRC